MKSPTLITICVYTVSVFSGVAFSAIATPDWSRQEQGGAYRPVDLSADEDVVTELPEFTEPDFILV